MLRQPYAAPAVISVLILAVMLFAPQVLNDADTFWHLRAGLWMLDHRQVINSDIFSFTRSGAPWTTHEWLSEIMMAAAYRVGGWSGTIALAALAAAAAVAIVGWRVAKSLNGLAALVVLILGVACMSGSLLVRPHIIAMPLLALWTSLLLGARERNAPPPLWAALLIIPWANMHGGYVLAYPLLGVFGLEALIAAEPSRRLQVIGRWGVFAALALAAAFVTPHGLDALLHPIKLMTMSTLHTIGEWRPTDFSKLQPLEVAIMATLVFTFTRGLTLQPVRILLLLVLLHMALTHVRHALVVGLIAPMILAEPVARSLGQSPVAADGRRSAIIAGALALALVGLRFALPAELRDARAVPATALAKVPAELRAQPVLNTYAFGGFLILNDVKTFIDGRADMFGDPFIVDYFAMMAPDTRKLATTLEGRRIAWTFLEPNESAIAAMDQMPGWRRLYADQYAVVHVREAMPSPVP